MTHLIEDRTERAPVAVVERLVSLACLAPSVHNTQPWSWRAAGDRLQLYADRRRQLAEEDPLGRNLVISCGAALDHLKVAARALGLAADVTRLPHGPRSDLLAEVTLSPGAPSTTATEDITLLRTRCTDRRRFTSWPVPPAALERLADESRDRGADVLSVTDPRLRFRLEMLTQRAHLLRELVPEAVIEQRRWVGRDGTDGVPLGVLPSEPGSSRFQPGSVTETRSILEGGDGVIVLGGETDDPMAWLRTGEGLSALWLRATRDGLSVVPLSMPLEVESVRRDLRDVLQHGSLEPHLVLRVGWQAIGRSELPRTPRRSVSDVLSMEEQGPGKAGSPAVHAGRSSFLA